MSIIVNYEYLSIYSVGQNEININIIFLNTLTIYFKDIKQHSTQVFLNILIYFCDKYILCKIADTHHFKIFIFKSFFQSVKKIKDKAEKDVTKRLEKSDKLQKKMDKERETEQKLLDKERELLESVEKGEGNLHI